MVNLVTFATTDWKNFWKYLPLKLKYIQDRHGLFKCYDILNENDLGDDWKDIFLKYERRQGYYMWSWKPYIIKKYLDFVDNNEYLLYLDGGCRFPIEVEKYLKLFHNFMDKIHNTNFNIFLSNPCPESLIVQIRKSILERFNLLNDEYFKYQYRHLQCGVMLIKKTINSQKFINMWYEDIKKNYKNDLDFDRYDTTGQLKEFRLNNGDQSIFQCLEYLNKDKINIQCDDTCVLKKLYRRQRG